MPTDQQDAVQDRGEDSGAWIRAGGVDAGALDNLATGTTTARDHRGIVRPGALAGLTSAEREQLRLRYGPEELDPPPVPVDVEAVLRDASSSDGVLLGGVVSRMSPRQWAALLDGCGIRVEAALESVCYHGI